MPRTFMYKVIEDLIVDPQPRKNITFQPRTPNCLSKLVCFVFPLSIKEKQEQNNEQKRNLLARPCCAHQGPPWLSARIDPAWKCSPLSSLLCRSMTSEPCSSGHAQSSGGAGATSGEEEKLPVNRRHMIVGLITGLDLFTLNVSRRGFDDSSRRLHMTFFLVRYLAKITRNVRQHKIVKSRNLQEKSESSVICHCRRVRKCLASFHQHPCPLLHFRHLAQQECTSSVSDQ